MKEIELKHQEEIRGHKKRNLYNNKRSVERVSDPQRKK